MHHVVMHNSYKAAVHTTNNTRTLSEHQDRPHKLSTVLKQSGQLASMYSKLEKISFVFQLVPELVKRQMPLNVI